MAEILTDEQQVAILEEYKTTNITNKELAVKYDRTEEAIRRLTAGVQKDIVQVDEEDDKIEKAEKNNRLQALAALKELDVGVKNYAIGIKTLLDSGDPQYVRDGCKMLADTMGLSAKADKSSGSGGSKITDVQYVLRMPKRPKE